MAILLQELWGGSNGDPWSTLRWKNIWNQFGGAVNIQSTKGNMNGGTNTANNAFAHAQTIDEFRDFDATISFTAQSNTTGTADGHTVTFAFRGQNDSVKNSGTSYRLAFECLATDTLRLQKKTTTTWSDLDSVTFAISSADIVRTRLICIGESIAAFCWKNAGSSPYPVPTVDAVDNSFPTGSFGLMIESGTDGIADSVLWDDFTVRNEPRRPRLVRV
jgi:hypothetical protein